ncbi:diaminopimelate epimerase [Cytophagales bacterium LB-30]|uniref:Diaminopimelate epimerase n=1 Tax=Shiella aurantiaca TaxID=3058365 RepID=A0ABT8F632_9BACT|nr:diaminopimelate epimerase [Shiella aurantiaca]MDN4165734.1 diaminopimelate epimerase [Shiella aurantiaca]
MHIPFHKYQGTGNDFIMLDNRQGNLPAFSAQQISQLCHRRFGIGADGLIIVQPKAGYDFEMIYYNSDGSQSLCGNGSRCAVRFAQEQGYIQEKAHFLAYDGPHEAHIQGEIVHLAMADVAETRQLEADTFFINTGSPHHICFVNALHDYEVVSKGRAIRYSDTYKMAGTNVNFVEKKAPSSLFVRTYERGVENETLSCGTGVTAASLAAAIQGASSPVVVETLGGKLSVSFVRQPNGRFTDIWLIGPAVKVFEGIITQ